MAKAGTVARRIHQQVSQIASQVLEEQMPDIVKEHITYAVHHEVYESDYMPRVYERTGDLANPKYMPHQMVGPDILRVTSEKPLSQPSQYVSSASEIVAYGKHYAWGAGTLDERIGPRPFMGEALATLRESRDFPLALQKAFNARGVRSTIIR